MRSRTLGWILLGAALAAPATPAVALDEIVAERGWERVAYVENGDCRAEVRGNGKFYRIAGTGLRAGEVVRFHLENGNVPPVEYRIQADGSGEWRQFYLPFRWHRRGGTVTVDLASASCNLNLSFDWVRQTS